MRELEHLINRAPFAPESCEDAQSILQAVDYWREMLRDDAMGDEAAEVAHALGVALKGNRTLLELVLAPAQAQMTAGGELEEAER